MRAGGGSVSGALISARLCWSLPEAAEPEPVLLLLRPPPSRAERRGPPSHGPGPGFGPQQESGQSLL